VKKIIVDPPPGAINSNPLVLGPFGATDDVMSGPKGSEIFYPQSMASSTSKFSSGLIDYEKHIFTEK